MANKVLIKALREICAIAPAFSEESTEFNIADPHKGACPWRDKLREVQRIARVGLQDVGERETDD